MRATASRRSTGVAFIAIAAFLEASRYLAAAVFGSGVASWDRDLFQAMLQYVGPELRTGAFIALTLGTIYLILAEFETGRTKPDPSG